LRNAVADAPYPNGCPAPLSTVPASSASRPIAPAASVLARRHGASKARHVAGIERLAVEAPGTMPVAGGAGIERAAITLRLGAAGTSSAGAITVKLAVLATAFSRDDCTPTTSDLAGRLDAAVVAP
jgi:hypothetical protein